MSINKHTLDALANEIIAMSEADQAMRKSEQWDASIDTLTLAMFTGYY